MQAPSLYCKGVILPITQEGWAGGSHKEPSGKDVEYNIGLYYYCLKARMPFCSHCAIVQCTAAVLTCAAVSWAR